MSSVIDICNNTKQETDFVQYIGNPCYPSNGPSDALDCNCEIQHDSAVNLTVTAVYTDINLCDSSGQEHECLTLGQPTPTCPVCTGPNIDFTAADFSLGTRVSLTEWIIRFTKVRSSQTRRGSFLLKLTSM